MEGTDAASIGALAPRVREPVGRYVYMSSTEEWNWSEAVLAVHGFEPGDIVPTTEVLLFHAHPDDRPGLVDVLEECKRSGKAFSCYYRLIDARERTRNVVIVGEGMRDVEREVIGIRGYLVDLTESRVRETSAEAREAVARASESRAVIEQAKGALMLTYGIDATAAYVILAWRSQQDNIKLRDLAQRLVAVMESEEATSADMGALMDKVLDSIAWTGADWVG